ncbi:hypothetical protein LSAT2_001505 [Lamellibrachia satsuma]|nr:hypothetical protein LSAT2_001505 [Lamellibrachia satsuma]
MFQQNYSKWKAVMDNHFRLRQIRHHNTIYIQPLDEFPEFIYSSIGSNTDTVCGTTVGGFFELLGEYMKVFFSGLNVIIQPAVKTTGTGWKVQSRYHHMTGKKQLLVGDVHEGLKKILPKDGCCVVGITWTDLYPCEDLNFVLGEATVEHRCAAFCFGRYEPKCYVDGKVPAQIENIDGFIIWKMLKVISHETCHIFNLGHCVHFECLMNESSSLTQMLEQPNFLCPVCLCKLKKVARCNIVHRYQQLLKFYEDVYKLYPSTFMHDAIAWLKGVLTFLE